MSALTNRYRNSRRRRVLALVESAWATVSTLAPGLTGRLRLYSRSPWPKVFASSPLFTPSGQHLFRHEHEVDVETLLRRFGLKKAKPSDDERRRLEAKVREIVAVLPPPVRLPYEVRFFSYRKCSTALPVSGSGATASFRRERFVRPLH